MLIDIEMPVLNGIDAAKNLNSIFSDLRKNDPMIKIPAIIATSGGAFQCHTEAKLKFFDAYLPKPYSPNAMIEKIVSLLEIKAGKASIAPTAATICAI